MSTKVQSTTEYSKFKKITLNRDTADRHIQDLVAAIEEQGNISRISPVIVNEDMEVIDGQHRVLALQQLELPVYYLVINGANINTVRQMNNLQRAWSAKDFAQSYALAGNKNYQRFMKMAEDYGFPYSTLIEYISLDSKRGIYKSFRQGELMLSPEQDAEARAHLDLLKQAVDLVPRYKPNRSFARAFKQISTAKGYDHARFIRKLKFVGDTTLKNWTKVEDFLRAFEVIFNHKMSEKKLTRLY